uniref:Uncharacterized protein n=1 Tax=Triticum urartu TaxID=4572 RepID=A0A8R7P4N9_TRIUA
MHAVASVTKNSHLWSLDSRSGRRKRPNHPNLACVHDRLPRLAIRF